MADTMVILNPAARGTRAGGEWEKIQQLPGGPEIVTTASAGEARALAEKAVRDGYKTIVAAGGDGTINEVVNGLAGTPVTLGVLPIGTMNVFAAELGLPSKVEDAWAVVQAGHTREIDLAKANEQYFVQLAGVGLDAQVVKETSWEMKRSLGPLSYIIAVAQVALRKPPRLVVRGDNIHEEGSFVLVGNGRFYGGPLAFFKKAQVDDGELDVLIFKKMSYFDIARYLGSILMGNHTELDDVTYLQAREVHVSSEDIVPVEVDGELAMEAPVTFRVSTKKLRVLTPR